MKKLHQFLDRYDESIPLACILALVLIVSLFTVRAFSQSVSVVPWVTPRMQFLNSNGLPIASGCVYTYSAGTTSPLAVFTDSTGATQQTNPIVLDASGSAVAWLGPYSYKYVAYSRGTGGTVGTNCYSGTLLFTIDNVPGAGVSTVSTAFSALTAASNSAAGTFAMSGNTLDLNAAASFIAPKSAGLAPTTSARIGYDTTANKYVFGQNGATVSFGLASVSACPAGQFVNTPATAIAPPGCAAPSLTGSTCTNCTINGSSTFTGSINSASIGSSTISGSTFSGGTLTGTIAGDPTLSGNPTIGGTLHVVGDTTIDGELIMSTNGIIMPAPVIDIQAQGSLSLVGGLYGNLQAVESNNVIRMIWNGTCIQLWVDATPKACI